MVTRVYRREGYIGTLTLTYTHYYTWKSRKWQPTPVFLPGEAHGQRSLAGYSPCGLKESDMTEVTDKWTYLSMWSQRVRHELKWQFCLYVKQTSKKLLYSSENSILCNHLYDKRTSEYMNNSFTLLYTWN